MERNSAKQTVPQPSASRKKQQKKTNAAGKHTGRPSHMPIDAAEAQKRKRVLYGGKRLKSGITIPIDESCPSGDETDVVYNSEEWTPLNSGDETDESTEPTNIVEPSLPVHNTRHETLVFFDIKDVPVTLEDDPLPLCSNENYPDFSFQHNGDGIKVRDETRPPELKRPGRQGRVTFAIGGKHLLYPACGIRNAVNCKVNVSAIQVRTPESGVGGGVTVSPGMLTRVEPDSRWLLIQAITAHSSGDSRYRQSYLITILM